MSTSPARLPWIDHLRTFAILLVVNMHACVTYSHVGDWYVMIKPEPALAQKVPFIVWQGTLQSFFMGLLFFVSGYFAAGSLQRRGAAAFVRERLFRLGLPALGYMLVIHPFILLALNPWHAKFAPPAEFYFNYVRTGRFLASSGPLWFAVALLIFCLGLSAWRSLRPAVAPANNSIETPPPSATTLVVAALLIGLGNFAVRIVQPIGTNVLNLQLCFFAQYIVFFAAGVHAARQGWLLPLAASKRAAVAGWCALVGGPVVMLVVLGVGSKTAPITAFMGGWNWQAFALALWEQFSGVGLSLGLLALFSRKLNFETPRLRWLADRSFGVYVFHAPIIIALAMLFRNTLTYHLYGLVLGLTAAGLVASFAMAEIARRIPGLKRIV